MPAAGSKQRTSSVRGSVSVTWTSARYFLSAVRREKEREDNVDFFTNINEMVTLAHTAASFAHGRFQTPMLEA